MKRNNNFGISQIARGNADSLKILSQRKGLDVNKAYSDAQNTSQILGIAGIIAGAFVAVAAPVVYNWSKMKFLGPKSKKD